jgi:hypothetical protein
MLLSLAALSLWGGNSIFSYYGFPVQYFGRDIYSLGMGDSGASDIFRYNTGYANPAMANRSNRTLFSTGIIAGYTKYQSEYSGTKRSFIDDALDFPYFSLSIPIKQHRIGFQFNSYASGLVKNKHALTDSTFELQSMDRYLYRADLIYSFNYRKFSLGLGGNYYFGHDKHTFEQIGDSSETSAQEALERSYKNPTLTFGALQSYGSHSLGIHASLPVTLKGESQRSSSHTTEPAVDHEYKLPAQVCISYTGIPKTEWKTTLDYTWEPYSETADDLQDSWKLGAGVAWEPSRDAHKQWWKKIPLRAGYSYRTLPFKDNNGNEIDEMAYTLGWSIPLKREVDRLDFALQYISRGDLGVNKLSDQSLMLMLGITGFDIISKAPDRTAPRDIPAAEEIDVW